MSVVVRRPHVRHYRAPAGAVSSVMPTPATAGAGGIHLFMVQSTVKSQMDFSRAQKYLRPGWWWGDGSCREKLLSVFHENVYPNKRIYSYHFGLFGGPGQILGPGMGRFEGPLPI